jgi:hypothetical protein
MGYKTARIQKTGRHFLPTFTKTGRHFLPVLLDLKIFRAILSERR